MYRRGSMQFHGVVQFRSSVQPGIGPPGEKEILALNPQRMERILEVTNWDRLEAGSLNLLVENAVVVDLFNLTAVWIEDAASVRYPEGWQHIPQIRKAYYYYPATASHVNGSQPVLVRRALVPVPRVVELFAPGNLTSKFNLSARDLVTVKMGDE